MEKAHQHTTRDSQSDTPLLATKLHAPLPRPNLVPRPRLIERLNAGLEHRGGFTRKLSVVAAPAGFGKTTLVSEWLSQRAHPSSWLSLDEGDNDPARFFAYLLAALRSIDAGLGRTARAMLQAPEPPQPEPLLTSLLNDIAAASQSFILVLDDYHLIHSMPIHRQLAFLVDHMPPQMHLVIATREEPPLPLSLLRARGQVVDIRQSNLRFSAAEVAGFLCHVTGLELSSGDVTALQQRTEGWIAGLQLAALSLQGTDDVQRFVASFTGSNRYILDYLMDEVFRQRPAHTGEFLLKTSILDRFCAPLCDAVRSEQDGVQSAAGERLHKDSRQVLLDLEQANLFVIPLDESRRWYRYHHLFADLLRHRLEIEGKYDVAALHRRASGWFAANGWPAEAIDHALAAADWETAAGLIVDLSESLLKRGEVATSLRWFQALPVDFVYADPRLCYEFSWPLILTEQFDEAEPYLAHAERAALASEDTSLRSGVALTRAHIARERGDYAQVSALSEEALTLLPEDAHHARSVVTLNLGLAHWYRGQMSQATQALSQARRAGEAAGNEYARWTASVFIIRARSAQGRLHQAEAAYRRLLQRGGQVPYAALAHYDLGGLLYEWNDLDAAANYIQQGLELAKGSGRVGFEADGLILWSLIEQARDKPGAAQEAIEEADRLLAQSGIPPATRLRGLAAQIAIALAQGDVDGASLMAGRAPKLEDAASFPDGLRLMLGKVRVRLAYGERAEAADRLAVLHHQASEAGWKSIAIQTCALQALAAPTPNEALTFLAEALALAEPEGYVRAFVDLGEPVRSLISDYRSWIEDPSLETKSRRPVAYAGKLLAEFDGPRSRTGRHVERPESLLQNLVEPLSDRELEVLHLLAKGQTNHEIARALYLSVNTVKTHLKNIYGKLGVHSRRQAVTKAQELGLLA